jgi:hypothetical protein
MLKRFVLGTFAVALGALLLPAEVDGYGGCHGYSGSRTTSYSGSGGSSGSRTTSYSGSGSGGSYSGSRTTTYNGSGGSSGSRTTTSSGSRSYSGGGYGTGGQGTSGGVNPYQREASSNYAGTAGTGYMAGSYHNVGGYGYVR